MHKVSRLMTRIANQPLLINSGKLEIILDMVAIPILMGNVEEVDKTPSMSWKTQKDGRSALSPTNTSIGVINVFDSLVSKNASAASGMTSYESIRKQMFELRDAGMQEIGFYLDTPGGEAMGLFSLTADIRKLQDEGITTWAYTDGLATSAGYAIGAACQYFYAAPLSIVASIAAIMVHVDLSGSDALTGKKYTFFRSKAEKALGDSHTALDETVIKKFTESLAYLDNEFNNDVLLGRPNVSLETILDLKGSELYASDALKLGLVDAIAPTLADAIAFDRKSKLAVPGGKNKLKVGANISKTSGGLMTLSYEELDSALKSEQEKNAALEARISELQTETVTAVIQAKSDVIKLFEAADTLRLNAAINVAETLKEHLEAGFTTEQSTVLLTQFAKGVSPKIDSSGGVHVGFVNPKEEGNPDRASFLAAAYSKATGHIPKASV